MGHYDEQYERQLDSRLGSVRCQDYHTKEEWPEVNRQCNMCGEVYTNPEDAILCGAKDSEEWEVWSDSLAKPFKEDRDFFHEWFRREDESSDYSEESIERIQREIEKANKALFDDELMKKSSNSGNPKDKYGDKKAQLHLIPATALIHEAEAMRQGSDKYGPYNWREHSVRAEVYISAAMRHMMSWYNGEDVDTESGANHLGHARACLGILLDAMECDTLIDNRPEPAPVGDMLRNMKEE